MVFYIFLGMISINEYCILWCFEGVDRSLIENGNYRKEERNGNKGNFYCRNFVLFVVKVGDKDIIKKLDILIFFDRQCCFYLKKLC